MFRVHNFCRWFALISQKRLLFKLISLDIIKLRFYGNGFTHVFWSWNYFSISHRIQFLQCISFWFCRKKFTHKILHRHSWFYNYLYTKGNFNKLYIHTSTINYIIYKGLYHWWIDSHSREPNSRGEMEEQIVLILEEKISLITGMFP